MKKKIAIIGTREGFTENQVHNKLSILLANSPEVIITGGARGVDKFAETFANKFGYKLEIIRPINPSNKIDYLFRNIEIITKVDLIIAFWDGKSKGTKFVIDYAKARHKEIKIIKLAEIDK